jgi:hypothetical protein
MYTMAVKMLPVLAWRGIGRGDQHHLLESIAGSTARDGAASAVDATMPDVAVKLLDQGRGVLWSQLLETRTDLDALHDAHPVLAAALASCRARLDGSTQLRSA